MKKNIQQAKMRSLHRKKWLEGIMSVVSLLFFITMYVFHCIFQDKIIEITDIMAWSLISFGVACLMQAVLWRLEYDSFNIVHRTWYGKTRRLTFNDITRVRIWGWVDLVNIKTKKGYIIIQITGLVGSGDLNEFLSLIPKRKFR